LKDLVDLLTESRGGAQHCSCCDLVLGSEKKKKEKIKRNNNNNNNKQRGRTAPLSTVFLQK
jgi:hypothetical protein